MNRGGLFGQKAYTIKFIEMSKTKFKQNCKRHSNSVGTKLLHIVVNESTIYYSIQKWTFSWIFNMKYKKKKKIIIMRNSKNDDK